MKLSKKISNLLNSIVLSGAFWVFLLSLVAILSLYMPSEITVTTLNNINNQPICFVKTDNKVIALSFDLDNSNTEIQNILKILESLNIKSTFFVTGTFAKNNPNMIKEIVNGSHDLGNHTQTHQNLTDLSRKECKQEIKSLHDTIKKISGVDMTLFRPPYSSFNHTVMDCAKSLSYDTVNFTIDSLDWKDYRAEDIVKNIMNSNNLGNGSIILLHGDGKYTTQCIKLLVQELKTSGYEIVPVSQLIYETDVNGA